MAFYQFVIFVSVTVCFPKNGSLAEIGMDDSV